MTAEQLFQIIGKLFVENELLHQEMKRTQQENEKLKQKLDEIARGEENGE